MIHAWAFILLAMAAYRSWRLLAIDKLTDPVRKRLLGYDDEHLGLRSWINCPWCFGAWVALGWYSAYLIWVTGTLYAAAAFALSLVVGLIARNLDP